MSALSAAPTPLLVTNGTEADLAIQGWDDHGLFKDAPEALKLFDEIEEERDRHLVEVNDLSLGLKHSTSLSRRPSAPVGEPQKSVSPECLAIGA